MPRLCFFHAVERDNHRSIRRTPIEANGSPKMDDVVTAKRLNVAGLSEG